jgi:predicted secreted protein
MLQLETLNTDGQQFLRDWNVGDTATAAVGGLTVTDVITEAQIDLQANEPPRVLPTIGGNPLTLAQWRLAQQQSRRLRQLERT